MALEQSTGADGKKDSIFFVYYTQYDEKKVGGSLSLKLRPYIRVGGAKLLTGWDFFFLVSVSPRVHK